MRPAIFQEIRLWSSFEVMISKVKDLPNKNQNPGMQFCEYISILVFFFFKYLTNDAKFIKNIMF